VIQLLKREKKEKRFWKTFWKGDCSSPNTPEESMQRTKISVLGFTMPWNLIALQGVAVWIILSPSLLNLDAVAADSNYIIGPLVFALATLSFSELLRSLRLWNALLALALILSGLFLEGFTFYGRISNVFIGICICILLGPSGVLREKYGKKT
jgi:hypothetical protein